MLIRTLVREGDDKLLCLFVGGLVQYCAGKKDSSVK